MRLKEYSQKMSMDTNDRFVIDGDAGTKTVSKEIVKEAIGTPPVVSKDEDGLVPKTSELQSFSGHNNQYVLSADGNSKQVTWNKNNYIFVNGYVGHKGWYRVLALRRQEESIDGVIQDGSNAFVYKVSIIYEDEIHEFYVNLVGTNTYLVNVVPIYDYSNLSFYIDRVRVVSKGSSEGEVHYLDLHFNADFTSTHELKENIRVFCYGTNTAYPPEPFIEVLETPVDSGEIVRKTVDMNSNYNPFVIQTPEWDVLYDNVDIDGNSLESYTLPETYNTFMVVFGYYNSTRNYDINSAKQVIIPKTKSAEFVEPIYYTESSNTYDHITLALYKIAFNPTNRTLHIKVFKNSEHTFAVTYRFSILGQN